MAETIKIGGELESTATGNVVAAASAIKDKVKNKYQGQINAETDATLAQHASAINGLNSQNYVSVAATDQTADVTDVLPAEGSVDTIYRVGNWDSSQYDVTCYTEYAWDGSAYVPISTKTQIGEVFDISAYHATGGTLATYADLSAALDFNNGGGVPQSLQKGGMSIKFVQSSDHKYVQFRCMANAFTTDVTQWQGVDDEPTDESRNLVESGGVRLTLNNELPYVVMSEYAGQVHSYYPIRIKQGHTYRFLKTYNYSATSTSIFCRVVKSSEGQSSSITLISSAYVDFTADKDYNYIDFYNNPATTGGTQEVFVFDLEFFNKNVFTPLNTETTFSTNEKVKNVGIATEISDSNNNLAKSGQVYAGLINLSKRDSLFSINGKLLRTNGGTLDQSGFFVTPFIPVSAGETVIVAGYSGGTDYSYSLICFYREANESTFISAAGNDGSAGFRTRTVTVPAGAKYMRCGCNTLKYNESYVDCAFLSHLIKQCQQIEVLDNEMSTLIGNTITFTESCVPATAVKVPFNAKKGTTVTIKATPPSSFNKSNLRLYLRFYGSSSSSQYQVALNFTGSASPYIATYVCDKDYDVIYVYDTLDEEVAFEASQTGVVPLLEEEISVLQEGDPSIIITNGNSSSFDVKVFSDSKKEYLTHHFVKMYDERDMEYGDGQTTHLVTCDCWYSQDILDSNNHTLVQGNVNFINAINPSSGADFTGEGYYVGEGHGCAISTYTKFYADGEEIDPTALGSAEIKCNTFRMVEKVNYYADNASLSANSRSYPKLDANGDLILANIHFAEHTIERNNVITTWNRLTVKRDHTKFASVFAGMSRVYLPYFSHLVLNDPDNSANGFTHDGTDWTITDEGGAGIVLVNGTDQFLRGSNVIFYGDDYFYSQTIEQMSRPWDKLNLRNTVYNDTIKSVKIYQLPAICTSSASVLGETAEEFMNGDVIECKLVRKIGCKSA